MNKLIKMGFMALCLMLLSNLDATAQRRDSDKKDKEKESEEKQETTTKTKTKQSTDKYFDETGGFKHRLWYGGNFALGFNSNPFGSSFAVGITPMVGYKIIGNLSAGPRVGVTYNSQGVPGERISWVDYSAGAFARYKFFKMLFLHAEYGYSSQAIGIGTDSNGKYVAEKVKRWGTNLGGGYSSSNGLMGYEIALLYDPSLANNQYISPWDIRFGFTYNF